MQRMETSCCIWKRQVFLWRHRKRSPISWPNASRTSNRALLMDYDGTLAPFSEDRRRAVPYPGIPALLDRIRNHANTRVVVVTGRRAIEVSKLLGLKRIEVWGCHGLSRLHASGKYEVAKLDETALNRISEINERLGRQGLVDLLEFKPAATAVHWRGIDPVKAKQVARKVRARLVDAGQSWRA